MGAEVVRSERLLTDPTVERRYRDLLTGRSTRTAAGVVALVGAAGVTILFGTTPVSIVLAGIAVVLLAAHPTLGPLGAAAVVMLTLPYDRAANGYLPRIANIPIRTQDIAVAVGLLLCLPSIRLRRPRAGFGSWLLVAFLAIGAVAVVIGFLRGNDARDILRDARWWFLYGSGLVLLFLPATARAQVVRGVLIGALAFAVVVILAAVVPAAPGGIKERSVEFDFGLLRLQFGNSVFLLFPLAWSARAWVRGRTVAIVPLALASVALMLTLTRTLMLVSAAVVLMVIAIRLLDMYLHRRSGRPWSSFARMGAAVAVLPLALAMALGIIVFADATSTISILSGQGTTTPGIGANGQPGEDPFGRVTFGNAQSGFGSIAGGRLTTYSRAFAIMAADPVAGSGMGATVVAEYVFGGETFATPGRLPNVDDAYLTAGMKAGFPAMIVLALLLLWPALVALRYLRGRTSRIWWLPAWLGILALTVTQSFATTGYGPFLLGMLVVIFGRGYASTSRRPAEAHE